MLRSQLEDALVRIEDKDRVIIMLEGRLNSWVKRTSAMGPGESIMGESKPGIGL